MKAALCLCALSTVPRVEPSRRDCGTNGPACEEVEVDRISQAISDDARLPVPGSSSPAVGTRSFLGPLPPRILLETVEGNVFDFDLRVHEVWRHDEWNSVDAASLE